MLCQVSHTENLQVKWLRLRGHSYPVKWSNIKFVRFSTTGYCKEGHMCRSSGRHNFLFSICSGVVVHGALFIAVTEPQASLRGTGAGRVCEMWTPEIVKNFAQKSSEWQSVLLAYCVLSKILEKFFDVDNNVTVTLFAVSVNASKVNCSPAKAGGRFLPFQSNGETRCDRGRQWLGEMTPVDWALTAHMSESVARLDACRWR